MSTLRFATCLGLLALASAAAHAGPRVDIDADPARNDNRTAHWERWAPAEGASLAYKVAGLTVTFAQTDPAAGTLAAQWWKPGLVNGATMTTDGLMAGGGRVTMTLEGLSPGPHTIVTYHNAFNADPVGPFAVLLGERTLLKAVQPTHRATDDQDAATAYIKVEAVAGQPVQIGFKPAAGGWVLNGFEIDAVDPARKAIKPVPAHDYEHVDGDGGFATLAWTPSASAVFHNVYFDADPDVVANAGTGDDAFRSNQTATEFKAAVPDTHASYYWRVDEVNGDGTVTRGDVWRFRPRHLAFPTAEGYGRFARGGRGGRVIEVTNLNDSGPGSLRAALQADGPRTVVFNVCGVIRLNSSLGIRNPYVTVAGQTAPGDGICVYGAGFGIAYSHDVILRFVRTRVGDISGRTLDGMGMAGCDNAIVDHCSISWSIDEGFSSRGARNITFQRNIIGEALNMSVHDHYVGTGKGHAFAASISGDVGSFHHNLLVHCAGRNWSLAGGLDQAAKHTGRLDIRNNVVYNWNHRTTDGGARQVNFVNNYYKPGPASREMDVLNPERNNIGGFGPQDYFVAGNVMEGRYGPETPLAGVDCPDEPIENFIVAKPFFDSYVETHTADEAYENVLANAGCNRPRQDALDLRMMRETRDGTTTYSGFFTGMPGIIDTVADTPGLPDYAEETRPADFDTDHDGMPNAWETKRGFNPDDPADGNADPDGDGYTNLEDYLNWLAGDLDDNLRRRES